MICQEDITVGQIVRCFSSLPAEGEIFVLGRIKVGKVLPRRIVKNRIAVQDRRCQEYLRINRVCAGGGKISPRPQRQQAGPAKGSGGQPGGKALQMGKVKKKEKHIQYK